MDRTALIAAASGGRSPRIDRIGGEVIGLDGGASTVRPCLRA